MNGLLAVPPSPSFVTPISRGVVEFFYPDIVTRATQVRIHGVLMEGIRDARSAVIRTSLCDYPLTELPKVLHQYAWCRTPAALVVPTCDYEYWSEWAELLGRELGLIRTVFRERNLEMARTWAESLAVRAKFRPSPPSRPRLYLVGR